MSRHGIDVSQSSEQLDVVWVPGSFELPIVSQELARKSKYEVVITLGAVIRGDTPHFDVVISEASKGIATVSRDTGIPIIFGVLTTDTMQQALERAGIKNNLEEQSSSLNPSRFLLNLQGENRETLLEEVFSILGRSKQSENYFFCF